MLVSHDRAFLNAVTQETIILRDGALTYFPGAYDAYMQVGLRRSISRTELVCGHAMRAGLLVTDRQSMQWWTAV